MTDSPFPCRTYEEAAKHLRRPFAPEAMNWKIQSQLSGKRGLIVGYLDARLVAERLNLVCPGLWSEETKPLGDRIDSGLFVCTITIDGLSRSDVGEGRGKAGWSDSFKRCAVRFGVGAPTYAVPAYILASTDKGEMQGDKPTLRRAKNKKGEDVLWLTPACERWLADQYREWLTDHGEKVFGEVLEHGDVEGSVGALLEDAPSEPAQDDLEVAAARQAAEEKLNGLNGELKPAQRNRFKSQLASASSVGEIEELMKRVEEAAA